MNEREHMRDQNWKKKKKNQREKEKSCKMHGEQYFSVLKLKISETKILKKYKSLMELLYKLRREKSRSSTPWAIP